WDTAALAYASGSDRRPQTFPGRCFPSVRHLPHRPRPFCGNFPFPATSRRIRLRLSGASSDNQRRSARPETTGDCPASRSSASERDKSMTHARFAPLWAVATLCLAAAVANAQEPFSKLVGPVKVGDAQTLTGPNTLAMPFILWGGDAATFDANRDTTTKPGTIYEKIGLKLKLYPGDDFVAHVKNYMEGKSAFLRGTASMLGLASEVLNSDPRTRPVVFLQLTWSRGDHMVGR